MIRSDSITWTAASLFAIAIHGVAVLTFASLLGEKPQHRHSELRLDRANSLAARPLGETSAPLVKASGSDASETIKTNENDTVVEEKPEGETIAESTVPSQSAPAIEAQSSSSAIEPPATREVGTEAVVADDGSEHAAIAESVTQVPSADAVAAESAPSAASQLSLPETPAPDHVAAAEDTDAPAEPAASTAGVAPQAASDVVHSSAAADVVTDSSDSAVAVAESQQPAADAQSATASPSPVPLSENRATPVTQSSTADTEASEAQAGTVLPETPDAAPAPPGPSVQASLDTATDEPAGVTPAPPADPGESNVAIQLPSPPKPPKPVQSPPSGPRDVLSAVRGFGSAPCFLAVPEQATNGQWQLRTYAGEQETLAAFEAHIKEAVGEVPNREKPLQQAQCAAADFAGGLLNGAPPALAFSLSDSEFDSGGHVAGTITGIREKWLYLLLIDDDGMMHDVTRYAAVSGGTITLDIPVHVNGGGRSRTQLLLAVASAKPLSMLDLTEARPLAEVLPLVRGQIKAAKARVDVAVQDFSVR